MATVFMKWLETSPEKYDRGIQLLTLGRLQKLKQVLAARYVHPGMQVLEIGCGTGELTALMAARGAQVTGVDVSPAMLGVAQKKLQAEIQTGQVELHLMDASMVAERLPEHTFDLIVSTLVFSELPLEEQRYVLEACVRLLKPGGRLLIADEVIPAGFLPRLLYYLVRLPLVLLTWLLTRATTRSLRDFETTLAESGFSARRAVVYLGGSLVLYHARPQTADNRLQDAARSLSIPRLRHRVTPKTLLTDLWCLFFRILPPYPKCKTGLYAIGQPDRKSPVLVTGNFDLTVRRVVKALDGKVDCYLLVADSAGINVWCAAGGGYFTAEKVIAAFKTYRVAEMVDHHALILPQLCANGVNGWKIRQETGWGVHWGPVKAKDIPAYLAGHRKKNDAMRWVDFPLKDRLEMVTVTLGFYALMILLPIFIWWRHLFWPVTVALLGLSYFYAIVHPWLPGRDGLWKSIPLSLIALTGLWAYSILIAPLSPQQFINWSLGLIGLSVFTGGELQGMSPLMRGEQANWGVEIVIGAVLA
ncbi:MAG: methyltransferase domain-containing protein, partial [Anaerolineae bacterium]